MSGNSRPDGRKAPPERKQSAKEADTGDRCDLEYNLDLSAVQIRLLRTLTIGSILDLDLVEADKFEAVVCKRPVERDVVGTLAAFEGLAELIDCMRRGNRYLARITQINGATCTVHVQRAVR
jgi:hypothetical protein